MEKLVCIVGPSGVGKTSYINRLKKEFGFSTPTIITTRKPREDDSSHYIYVSESLFHELVESDIFLEWDQYGGYYYGTKEESVIALIAENHSACVLDLTPAGCRQVQVKIPNAKIIALLPDDKSWLNERLFERGMNDKFDIVQRTKLLDEYIKQVEEMNVVIIWCKFSPSSWEITFQEIVDIING